MTKDVLISISGLQFELDSEDVIEVISAGEYHYKNGKHYITYEEISEEDNSKTNNIIKISENKVDIIKNGSSNVHMVFEENKQNMTFYHTPFGALYIGINTTKVKVSETENEITVIIEYGLDVNYAHISDCVITMKVYSKLPSNN